MADNSCPGKTMLKVVGIIMIVFSAISIVVGLLALAGAGLVAGNSELIDTMPEISDLGVNAATIGAAAAVFGVVAILSSTFQLVLGILAVKNCAKPGKANLLFVLGCVSLAIALVSLIGSSVTWSTLISFILPALYTIGAYQNKKAA